MRRPQRIRGALRRALIPTDSEKMHRKGSFHRGLAGWVEFVRGRVKVGKIQIPTGYKGRWHDTKGIYQSMMGDNHVMIIPYSTASEMHVF